MSYNIHIHYQSFHKFHWIPCRYCQSKKVYFNITQLHKIVRWRRKKWVNGLSATPSANEFLLLDLSLSLWFMLKTRYIAPPLQQPPSPPLGNHPFKSAFSTVNSRKSPWLFFLLFYACVCFSSLNKRDTHYKDYDDIIACCW